MDAEEAAQQHYLVHVGGISCVHLQQLHTNRTKAVSVSSKNEPVTGHWNYDNDALFYP